MDSRELIDAQFDRAVEIVQSLPKNGPIQTDYEEKLTMYSLYKQATVGNVTSSRPGIFDMLGRAKWDAWAKHKDLDPYEAKWLYVEALMKVLKKYPDKTKELVQELESYAGDAANIMMSRSLSRGSDSSGSSVSETGVTPYSAHLRAAVPPRYYQNQIEPVRERNESLSEDDTMADNDRRPTAGLSYREPIPRQRPMSSMSGHRYRTPMTGSTMLSPPPHSSSVPAQQPLPRFESQSVFDENYHISENIPAATTSYPSHLAPSSRSDAGGGPVLMHPQQYRVAGATPMQSGRVSATPVPFLPSSRPTIERAIENVQAHLAALTERLESLELSAHALRVSSSLSPGARSPNGSGANDGSSRRTNIFNFEDMGLWTVVLQPLSRILKGMRHVTAFLAVNENRTPALVVIRRLFLDISFLLCAIALFKLGWKKSGVRRAEILAALGVLGRAIAGERRPRQMVSRGI